MFYKITNTESEVYKKLHAIRTQELQWEADNKQAIKDKVGLHYNNYIGYGSQTGFNRNTEYIGFEFNETDKVNPKIWKEMKEQKGFFEPNLRTKLGKEMAEFLRKLKGNSYTVLLEPLGLNHLFGRFTIPRMYLSKHGILLQLDDSHNPEDPNVIEITKTEYLKLGADLDEELPKPQPHVTRS